MNSLRFCSNYLDINSPGFIAEYRGDFKSQIDKVSYACGDIITSTLAVVVVPPEYLGQLRKDVPSIIFIEFRSIYVLQDISPSNVDSINEVKINPYLNLTGKGILIGMIDTGIDYLNKEFIREDGTSRIINIWDQSIYVQNGSNYIGEIYTNEDINKALEEHRKGNDPYLIVPSKDEENHGTKMASIIGSRGYNEDIEGIAPDCEFVIVKLLPSSNIKKYLEQNNVPVVPAYNNSEVLSGIEYLKNISLKLKRPMVIYIGVGTTYGSHDGNSVTSRFLTSISRARGIILVSGTGNEGDAEGHVSQIIDNPEKIDTSELLIPREIKRFAFYIWIQRPNRMVLNIISPTGETTDFIIGGLESVQKRTFILLNTKLTITNYDPDPYTGHQVFYLDFEDMKPGIWRIQLIGEYIVTGRYDIWLPPKIILPEGTRFLNSNPSTTLTVPSTAPKVITVAYINNIQNSLMSSSGKGFNSNGLLNPDIATAGVNILTTSNSNQVTTASGSSAATAIVCGVCALLLQWSILQKNDTTMYTTKMRSYLIYSAYRLPIYEYPNQDIGYGLLNLLNIFNILGGNFRSNLINEDEFIEYYINNLFIRMPRTPN